MLAPGWTSYDHRLRYQTYDVTALLRAGRERARRDRSATAGTAAGSASTAGAATSTATGRRCSPSSRSRYADGTARARRDRRRLARGAPGRSSPPTSTTARPTTRALERAGWSPPASTTAAGRRVRVGRARPSPTLVAPTGPPVRRTEELAPVAIAAPRRRARRSLDFGQNLVGRLRIRVQRRGRARRSRCATPRCSRTASSASARCASAAATDRYTLRGGGAEELGAALHLPRLPLRRGRRLARASSTRRTITRGRRATPTWSAPAGSPAPTRCSTGCTRTSSGACAATSSTSRPTARSATSGSAGPATSRSSRPPRAFLYDCAGLLASWLRDLAAEQRDAAASCRSSCPTSAAATSAADAGRGGWGDAAVDRAVGAVRALRRRRRARARSTTACAAWVDLVAALRRRATGSGTSGFQFGDWLDPAAPPDEPGRGADRPAPRRHRVPRPLGRARRPGRRGARARPTTPRATRALAAEVARRRSTREYVTPDRPDRQRRADAYALALEFDLLPTRRAARARGRAAGRARARRRLPDRHRLRRHAAHLRRARAAPASRRRRLPAAAPARVPVVALPGHDGRDDDLGALGQHAARRHGQPRRDDLVQPLRARRGRRLAAPHRRRPRAGRARLPPARVRPLPGRRPDATPAPRTRRRTAGRRSAWRARTAR